LLVSWWGCLFLRCGQLLGPYFLHSLHHLRMARPFESVFHMSSSSCIEASLNQTKTAP